MSTTVVAQLTGDRGNADEQVHEEFLLITIKEDGNDATINVEIEKALAEVDRFDEYDRGDGDTTGLRSAVASELKRHGMTLESMQVISYVDLGER